MSGWSIVAPNRIGLGTVLALAVAITAISSSAPLIAYAAAPPLAIAALRNVFATTALVPIAVTRRRHELRTLFRGAGRREGLFCVAAGIALAGHFATWIPSVTLTTIAAAAALGATQPVWQGLIARAQGRHLPWVAWVGIGVAVLGAIAATGADFQVSGRAVTGDVLAALGGLFAAIYTALGERARTATSTTTYTTICYGICAALLLVTCVVGHQPLTGYAPSTWLAIIGLTIGPQLLGHSMFSFTLKRVSATTIAMLILLEVPGAALIGWLWLGQHPAASAIPGLALLMIGVAIVVVGGHLLGRRATVTPPPI